MKVYLLEQLNTIEIHNQVKAVCLSYEKADLIRTKLIAEEKANNPELKKSRMRIHKNAKYNFTYDFKQINHIFWSISEIETGIEIIND